MTDEQQALRERVLRLELQHGFLAERFDEALLALTKSNASVNELQKVLESLLNRGRGATLVVRCLLLLGGLGWAAGIVSFVETFLTPGK